MAHIAVNPENIRNIAAALRAHSSRIQGSVEAIEAEMQRLSADQFTGQRAEALRVRFQAARQRLTQYATMLGKFATQLEEAADAFRRADAAANGEGTQNGNGFQLTTTFSVGSNAARAQAAQAAIRAVNWGKLW